MEQKAVGFESDDASAPPRFGNMYKLYIVSVLIPTSSTDVERAFSLHKLILGRLRTRLLVQNIDSRMRGMLQVKPLIKELGYEWAGSPESTDSKLLHPYQLYLKLIEGKADFLTIALHARLAKKNCKEWLECYAAMFDTLADECEQVAVDDLPSGVTTEEMEEQVRVMTQLLRFGV